MLRRLLLAATLAAAAAAAARPRAAAVEQAAAPSLYAYAVTLASGAGVAVVWPELAGSAASDYAVAACGAGDPACASPTAVAGAPAPLCAGCAAFTLVAPAEATPGTTRYIVTYTPVGGGAAIAAPAVAAEADAGGVAVAFVAPAPRGADGGGCGAWAAPCATVQAGIGSLPFGGFVWVLPGTYTGAGNRDISPTGKPLSIKSVAGSRWTTIDAAFAGRAFVFGAADTTVELRGFTLTRGYPGPAPAPPHGGCMLIDSASPALTDIKFVMCTTCDAGGACNGNGGAVAVVNSAGLFGPTGVPLVAPLITASSFASCYAGDFGGGLSFMGAGALLFGVDVSDCHSVTPGAGLGGGIAGLGGFLAADTLRVAGCTAPFSGGAAHLGTVWSVTPLGALGPLTNLVIEDNVGGLNCGGLSVIASGHVQVASSILRRNAAPFLGGAAIVMFANMTLTDTVVENNVAPYGGGGIYLTTGNLTATNVTFRDNVAADGGALAIVKSGGGTLVNISASTFARNRASGLYGGAVHVMSADAVAVAASVFDSNVATKGGAIRVKKDGGGGGGGGGGAGAPFVSIDNATLFNNVAQFGGGLLVDDGGAVTITASNFTANAAVAAGGGLAVGDGGVAVVADTLFSKNGNFSCVDAPTAGGGVAVGLDEFKPRVGCSPPAVTPPNATLLNCTFDANVGAVYGGALALRSGALALENATLVNNAVTGAPTLKARPAAAAPPPAGARARGGGLYVGPTCAAGACSSVAANVTNATVAGNAAAEAGGGLFFNGATAAAALAVTGGAFTANAAPAAGGGAGGGLAIVGPGARVNGTAIDGNAARYGGGVYVAADLDPAAAPPTLLANLTFASSNAADRGPDAFWVRAASPAAPLACAGCAWGGVVAAPPAGRVATEALAAALVGAAPPPVQSNEPAPAFSIALRDFYGAVSSTDDGGACVAEAAGGAQVLLPEAGRTAAADAGVALFDRFTVTGGVGETVAVDVTCTPPAAARPPAAPAAAPLPALTLSLAVANCSRGRQPPPAGTPYPVCSPCPFGTFSFDGAACVACREGGLCPGGAAGEATPVKAYAGYWRSTNDTDVPLYRCPDSAACRGVAAGSAESGDAAGDAACAGGTVGPLCTKCAHDYYKFGGKCKPCSGILAGKLMVGAAAVALALFLVAIFARTWGGGDVGPGPMTKLKIFTTHVQIVALLRDYDLLWPDSTLAALGWADTINIGVSIAAPECFLPGFSFWGAYAFAELLPAAAVALCVAVYAVAAAVAARSTAPATRARCAALQARCWRNAFWLVTLLYPRAAQSALQLFSLARLNVGTFLAADMGVLVRPPPSACGGAICPLTTTYKLMVPVGIAVLVLVAFGVPVIFFLTLFRNRARLQSDPVAMGRYGFLYVGQTFVYWDTIDTLRKLVLAALPVFIAPQPAGSLQALAGQLVVVATAGAVLAVKPFTDAEDNVATVASNVVLWLLLLSGSALKWARLSARATMGVAIAQVALTSGLGALVLVAVAVRYWRQLLALPRTVASAVAGGAAAVVRVLRGRTRGGSNGDAGDRRGGKVAPAPPDDDAFADAIDSKEGAAAVAAAAAAADAPVDDAEAGLASRDLIRTAGASGSGAPLLGSPPAGGRRRGTCVDDEEA